MQESYTAAPGASTQNADEVPRAWARHAPALAAWADKALVNRRDVYGRYLPLDQRKEGSTAITSKDGLTLAVLQRHFTGADPGDLIGLHSTARSRPPGPYPDADADCWSRWGAIDIDAHGEREDPDANRGFALGLYERAKDLGLSVLLLDSNGAGGFHLLVLFDGPVPTAKVFALLRWLIRDWKDAGVAGEPENFPKQRRIKPAGFGNWLRLPGRHHTRSFWSKVWDGSTWLEGTAAIKAIISTRGASAEAIPAEALAPPTKPRKPNPTPAPASGSGRERYALAALEREVAAVASAPEGGRNIALNKAGFALGQLVAAGALGRSEVETALLEAARSAGLGDAEAVSTIESGLSSGTAEPRDLSTVGSRNGRPAKATAGAERATNLRVVEPPDGDGPEVVDRWPVIDEHAFHGIAGEVVRLADPHTEADRVATLVQVLVAFGNMIGRGPHYVVGATRHYMNLFAVLIGLTAIGRKGTSWDVARWIVEAFDPEWGRDRIQSGLISGEGLIHHVRDATEKAGEVVDPGVPDKRLLVVETELSRPLKSMARDSNTLSDVLRQAWDSGSLRTLAKNNPVRATGAHVSVIGHSTQADVRRHLTATDTANGFANRFLWVSVRRSKELPDGGDIFQVDWGPVHREMARVVPIARATGKMTRDDAARGLWHSVYGELSSGKVGFAGGVLSRAEAQTMRLACLYALLDGSPVVETVHLTAALALWKYCEKSVHLIFGDAIGNPDGEKILAALRESPGGLTRTEISGVFGNNKPRDQIAAVLGELLTDGIIHRTTERTGPGRPSERWHLGRTGVALATN